MSHAVCVTLFTYNRMNYAQKTLDALRANLRTSYPLYLHIADDGTGWPDDFGMMSAEELANIERNLFWTGVTWSDTGHKGYGASYNLSTMTTHQIADIHLPLEDDWVLTKSLDLDPLIDALDAGIGDCIRLGNLGWTQDLKGTLKRTGAAVYLAFDPDSPEPHVFSGNPRLETRERQRRVGLWPEQLKAGATEWEVAHRPEARTGVMWPLDLIPPSSQLFAHIGTITVRGD